MISEIVVSSTNFHVLMLFTRRSFTIRKNSQGPNLVPWGTPEGTCLHDERASASLISVGQKVGYPGAHLSG